MPLWDSVQRSLEKASQEAARMAKTQRLRSITDGLIRQISTQNNNLLIKTMDLFSAGQLTQSELLPLCQEITNLQQQLNQAQNELKQIQATQMQTTGPQAQSGTPNPYLTSGPGGTASYPSTGEEPSTSVYAPPPPEYQSYLDSTHGVTFAPPPPGMESPTVSSIETRQINAGVAPPPSPATRRCAVCQAELASNNAFCPGCGAPVQDINSPHLPTVRGGSLEQIYPGGQATDATTTEVGKDEGV
jgi:hypothetical protein